MALNHYHEHDHRHTSATREGGALPRIGVGGPVGSGKTSLIEALVPGLLRRGYRPLVITNDIFTREDADHVTWAADHNERWLTWLTDEIGKLGLKVTPSAANFVLVHFPDAPGRAALDADAFLTSRGLITRNVASYKLPHALRITVGTEEANRLLVAALADFVAQHKAGAHG